MMDDRDSPRRYARSYVRQGCEQGFEAGLHRAIIALCDELERRFGRRPEVRLEEKGQTSIKGYKYQSDFARYWYTLGYKQGLEEGREAVLRHVIIELLGARLPGLRDELASGIRDQPVEWVASIFAELYSERDEDRVQAVLATAPGPVLREDPDFSRPRPTEKFVDDGTGPDWS